LFQVNMPSSEEITQIRSAEQQIADALDGYFRQAVERGFLPPFDTTSYAQMLTGLVNTVLQQCFGVERGEHEALYRERLIEMVERLFFGPPLVPEAGEAEKTK